MSSKRLSSYAREFCHGHASLIAHYLRALERNLDCTISAPFVCHDELESYVSKPVLKFVLHASGDHDVGTRLSDNLHSLKTVLRTLDINDDPYVISLCRKRAILS